MVNNQSVLLHDDCVCLVNVQCLHVPARRLYITWERRVMLLRDQTNKYLTGMRDAGIPCCILRDKFREALINSKIFRCAVGFCAYGMCISLSLSHAHACVWWPMPVNYVRMTHASKSWNNLYPWESVSEIQSVKENCRLIVSVRVRQGSSKPVGCPPGSWILGWASPTPKFWWLRFCVGSPLVTKFLCGQVIFFWIAHATAEYVQQAYPDAKM